VALWLSPSRRACSFLPKGLRSYWKCEYVKGLFDEAIDAHIAQAANTPRELSLMREATNLPVSATQ
jgi:hypothetical protein